MICAEFWLGGFAFSIFLFGYRGKTLQWLKLPFLTFCRGAICVNGIFSQIQRIVLMDNPGLRRVEFWIFKLGLLFFESFDHFLFFEIWRRSGIGKNTWVPFLVDFDFAVDLDRLWKQGRTWVPFDFPVVLVNAFDQSWFAVDFRQILEIVLNFFPIDVDIRHSELLKLLLWWFSVLGNKFGLALGLDPWAAGGNVDFGNAIAVTR